MTWFFIALIGPILWALVNHIDKYIISKYFTGPGVGSLVIFTSMSGLIISFFILWLNFSQIFISPLGVIIIAVNGALLVASFIPYLYALEKEEASWVSSIYQLIPVFGYVLGLIFLNEHLALRQIMSSLLIIVGAVFISLDFSQKNMFKMKPFMLMLLSSFMLAVNALVFKMVALDQFFWGVAFWEYIGGGIFGLILLIIPLYRKQFIATIYKSKKNVLGLNLGAELLNIGAKLVTNFASLLAPLALVLLINGFQPLIVFILGLIFTVFFPVFGKENISRTIIIQKLASMLIMFIGIYFLFN